MEIIQNEDYLDDIFADFDDIKRKDGNKGNDNFKRTKGFGNGHNGKISGKNIGKYGGSGVHKKTKAKKVLNNLIDSEFYV